MAGFRRRAPAAGSPGCSPDPGAVLGLAPHRIAFPDAEGVVERLQVHQRPDGAEHAFRGVYREITPPERLVYTFVYDVEGAREHPGLVTDVFNEQSRRTTALVETMLFPSREERDGVLQSGMKEGAAETLDRLAELLATLTAPAK